MGTTASKIVEIMQGWVGAKQGDATHKAIIDLYNTQNPLPVGYKMTYNDAWCAATVTAAFMKAGALNMIYGECGCERMIRGMRNMGIYTEDDNHDAQPGTIIFYDWDDKGVGDCTGSADHVGIVEKNTGSGFVVIEGNFSTKKTVARRTVKRNQIYIRGFAIPKYDPEPTQQKGTTPAPAPAAFAEPTKNIKKGSTGEGVKWAQTKLNENGASLVVDGIFGLATLNATLAFQKKRGLVVDGIIGPATRAALKNEAAAPKPATFAAYNVKVTAKNGLNLRTGAGVNFSKLTAMPCGAKLTVTEEKSGWGKVTYNGRTGWACLDYTARV